MARIRSVKPDFFTSETIARLPVSARLTFIGLWTHADDNGVCLANERLIAAALCPLDGPEGLQRTREDLRRISGESLVTLYERSGKRYLFINSWDEHQKVSHPGKPRFPRPSEEGCKSVDWENVNPPETLPRSSGDSPETLARSSALSREQGAGSREQGVPKTTSSGAGKPAPPRPPKVRRDTSPNGPRAEAIAKSFYDSVNGLCNFIAVRTVVLKAINAGATDEAITAALRRINENGKPVSTETLRAELNGTRPSFRPGSAPNRFAEQ